MNVLASLYFEQRKNAKEVIRDQKETMKEAQETTLFGEKFKNFISDT